MPWYDWPWSGEYTADTHVVDRVSAVSPDMIYSGLARDIANIQHHINTTHLIASGYTYPVLSGWFDYIDVNNLSVENLYTRTITFNDIPTTNIQTVLFTDSTPVIHFYDSALRFNIPINDRFQTASRLCVSASGLYYNGPSISGSIAPYDLVSGGSSTFQGMDVERNLTLNTGWIKFDDPLNKYIILGNLSNVHTSGSLLENKIYWHSLGGHDHKSNKINAASILDSDIIYKTTPSYTPKASTIDIDNGFIDAEHYDVSSYYDTSDEFIEILGLKSGYYRDDTCPTVSGFAQDLDLGLYNIVSFRNKVYASSDTAPNNLITTHSGVATNYIYETEDFYSWNAIPMSGLISTSGGYVRGMSVYADDLWVLSSNQQYSGKNDAMVQKLADRNDPTLHYWNAGATVSAYPHGMSVVNHALCIYGYEGDYHTASMPQWDKYRFYMNQAEAATAAGGLDASIAGLPFTYTEPMLLCKGVNETSYDFTDYDVDLFHRGLNEVTALTSFHAAVNYGTHHHRTVDTNSYAIYMPRLVHRLDASIIFGTAYNLTYNNSSGAVFGGCVPAYQIANINASKGKWEEPFKMEDISLAAVYGVMINEPVSLIGNYNLTHSRSDMYSAYSLSSGVIPGGCWTDSANPATYDDTVVICRNPFETCLLSAPFCDPTRLYCLNSGDLEISKLSFVSASGNPYGILITSGTYSTTRDMPTYFDREQVNGFWGVKQLNWFYTGGADADDPPSGCLSPTYYYMQPISPVSHRGVGYCALKYNTGFNYIGESGPEYIDDGIMYTSLIEFEGRLYGIGNQVTKQNIVTETGLPTESYSYRLIICEIIGRTSKPIYTKATSDNMYKQYQFFIHRHRLYAGLGENRFLVKSASHSNIVRSRTKR